MSRINIISHVQYDIDSICRCYVASKTSCYYYSGGKKNPDLLLFYQKKRTNYSETTKQITKTVNLYLKYNMYK